MLASSLPIAHLAYARSAKLLYDPPVHTRSYSASPRCCNAFLFFGLGCPLLAYGPLTGFVFRALVEGRGLEASSVSGMTLSETMSAVWLIPGGWGKAGKKQRSCEFQTSGSG